MKQYFDERVLVLFVSIVYIYHFKNSFVPLSIKALNGKLQYLEANPCNSAFKSNWTHVHMMMTLCWWGCFTLTAHIMYIIMMTTVVLYDGQCVVLCCVYACVWKSILSYVLQHMHKYKRVHRKAHQEMSCAFLLMVLVVWLCTRKRWGRRRLQV